MSGRVEVERAKRSAITIYVWGADTPLPDLGGTWESEGWNGRPGADSEARYSLVPHADHRGVEQVRAARRLRALRRQ